MIRAELIIATFALITSACASVAAIMQAREGLAQTRASIAEAHTVAVQLGASVWPYVTFGSDFSPGHVSLSVTNQGLGPALVSRFTISGPKGPMVRMRQIADAIDSNVRTFADGSIGGGSVIRPSQTIEFLSISDRSLIASRAHAKVRALHMRICYCSLLKECWTLASSDSEPKAVSDCGPPTAALGEF